MRGRWFIGVEGAWRYRCTQFTNCPRYFLVAGTNEKLMRQETETEDLQKDLKRFMALHGITSVDDVMKLPAAELLKMGGFGYRLLNYLLDLKKQRTVTES